MQARPRASTWQTVAVLSDEGRLTTVVVPQMLDQGPRLVDVLWLDGRMEDWTNYQTKVMAHQIPEPSTVVLLLLGAGGVLPRCNRRERFVP